jgi:serine/threonine protein phosphatase 1
MFGLKRLFSSSKPVSEPPRPGIPEGQRVYAIGDIHGRDDLLRKLLGIIESHRAGYSGKVSYVFLGDYVDRGMQSKQVIDTLMGYDYAGAEAIFLRGNHEQVMLDILVEPMMAKGWLAFGGLETLLSYRIPTKGIPTKEEDFIRLSQQMERQIPARHLEFMRDTRISWELGDCLFVHAGVHPDYPLDEQQERDLLWIKEEFIDSPRKYEKLIVHGHYIEDEPALLSHRVGLDTGAYVSECLSCGVFEGDQVTLLDTQGRGQSEGEEGQS